MHTINALRHLVAELQASSQRILEYSRNRSATGLHREKLVENCIRKIAPRAFSIGSGFIYGPATSSAQIDLIVYDSMHYSPLFDEGGYVVLLPAAAVYAVEVKSQLDKQGIIASFQNIESAKQHSPKCRGMILGFDGVEFDTAVNTVRTYLEETGPTKSIEHLPDVIVSLGKWVLVQALEPDGSIAYASPEGTFEDQFFMAFSMLHYTFYGYVRQLQTRETVLPTLAQQGFKLMFSPPKHQFTVRPKKPVE